MEHRRKLFITLVLAITLLGSSCWDRRELDDLAIATAVGIDQAEDPNKLLMTVEIILPQNVSTPGGGGGQGPASLNIQSQGTTPFEAAKRLTFESDKRIYFAHNPVLIFSEEMAKKGILPAFDFFIRDPEPRRTAWMLVAEGKAQDLINVQTILDPITGLYIEQLIESTGAASQIATLMVQGFLERLMSPTTAPYCSIIRIKGKENNKSMELSGTAIFKKDKMVGKFDYKEGRGLLWVLGEVESGIITVPCEKEGNIGLEIIRADAKITPAIIDNTLKVIINITEEGNLGEQECPIDLTAPEAWQSLERKQAEAIRQEVLAAVKKAQELNADVFGFGEAFHRKYKALWKEQLKNNWDEFFPDLEVEVLVEAKLRRTGTTTKPAVPE
ncbi:MAG: hypothetical protein VR72_11010 [Clostridiaceae bacterium BRH_c20a]|nr:MAG: hypothetical protein VR72_11010 [Clostridiaceae bacterium BRH_c20a]